MNFLKIILTYFLVAFILLFASELVKEGFVSNHFDLNAVLAVILTAGLAILIIEIKQKKL